MPGIRYTIPYTYRLIIIQINFFFLILINEILNDVRNSKSKYITDLSMFTIKEIILEISPLLKMYSLAEGIFTKVLKKRYSIFQIWRQSLAENYRSMGK